MKKLLLLPIVLLVLSGCTVQIEAGTDAYKSNQAHSDKDGNFAQDNTQYWEWNGYNQCAKETNAKVDEFNPTTE